MSQVDPFDTQVNDDSVDVQKAQSREARRQETEDLKWLMSDPRGRRFMWGLLSFTGIYRSSFTGNSETFFREGQRNVGLQYLNSINQHCPKRYNEMVTEQVK